MLKREGKRIKRIKIQMALEQLKVEKHERKRQRMLDKKKDQSQPGVGNPDVTGRELGVAIF